RVLFRSRDVHNHIEAEHLGTRVGSGIGSTFQVLDVDVHAGEKACNLMHDPGGVQGDHVDIVGVGAFRFAGLGALDHGGQLQLAGQVGESPFELGHGIPSAADQHHD